MSTSSSGQTTGVIVSSANSGFSKRSDAPGEQFEPRQTATSEDYEPDPSKSIKLSPQRQALVDDIIALYSCQPTVSRVKRYTADCVYDDQFVYANDRYKMAGQWFALPKLFSASTNEFYQVNKGANKEYVRRYGSGKEEGGGCAEDRFYELDGWGL